MIIIESKRKKPETILKKYPDAILADVTSGAKDGLAKRVHSILMVAFQSLLAMVIPQHVWIREQLNPESRMLSYFRGSSYGEKYHYQVQMVVLELLLRCCVWRLPK